VLTTGTDVLVATDARRREVYWALYRLVEPGTIDVLAGPEVAAAADVAADPRTAGVTAIGRGALLYADVLGAGATDGLLDPDPAELARLALSRTQDGQVLGTEPLYLRRPDAVPQAARKRVLG
jgi:tRNA threonylcarbamoyladenosine biosynthesis protein TsaB